MSGNGKIALLRGEIFFLVVDHLEYKKSILLMLISKR
jgi:hypothetical protein